MSFFNRQGRALLFAAVVAVGAVCVSCGAAVRSSYRKDNGAEDGQADTLANIEEKQSGEVRAGSFTDSRDGKTYKWVVIRGQTWMAENLNFATSSGSWCFEDDNSNCEKYGRLYDWETAKTVCPSGWHLPSSGAEWSKLVDYAGGHDAAGKYLKSTSGWNDDDEGGSGNGTDEFGFSALPGGGRYYSDGSFYNLGSSGKWWTATEFGGGKAFFRFMSYGDYVYESVDDVGKGFSVRCIGD